MSDLPRDGVQLVLENEAQFIKGLQQVNAAWDSTSKRFQTAGTGFSQFNKGFESIDRGAQSASRSTESWGQSIRNTFTEINSFIAIVERAGQALAKFSKGVYDLALQSSQLEGISAQFAATNQNIEGGAQAMLRALQQASAGMISNRDLMTQFNDAAALVNVNFAQRLPEALSLLSKVSAATGTDMNYLLESLTLGVGRLQPKIIDNLKIQVSVAQATEHATEMFGKQADSLSTLEKQTALMDLTLAKLEEKFGALPDTSETLVARSAALQASFQNIADTLGAFLVPGMTSLVESISKVVALFDAAISEGGTLEPLLIALGASFSLFADGINWAVDQAIAAVESLTGDIADTVGEAEVEAFSWGVELIAGFAEGIVHATSTVLTVALNTVGNMLSSWLLGSSPPKVAPGIVQWGSHTLEMYLRGMTEADFGILKEIQGPLKKVLEGPAFAQVTKTLTGALAGDDRGRFLDTVTQAAGQFGNAVRQLAMAQFNLADATEEVAQAEENLAKSRQDLLNAQGDINEAVTLYNRMLREGATQQELKDQLALVNAAEDRALVAAKQVPLQEQALKDAKEREQQLKTEANLQKDIVDQLLGVNDAMTEQEKTAAAKVGGVKGAGSILEEAVIGTGGGVDIGSRISEAIDKAKEKLKEKFQELFAPMITAWNNAKADIERIGQAWDTFVTKVGNAWDRIKEKYPILQDIETWLRNIPGLLFKADWSMFSQATGRAWEELKQKYPILQDVETWLKELPSHLRKAATVFDRWFTMSVRGAARILSNGGVGTLLYHAEEVYNFLKDDFLPFIEGTFKTTMISTLVEKILTPVESGFSGAATAAGKLIDKINELGGLTGILQTVGVGLIPFIGRSPSPLGKGLAEINREMDKLNLTSLPRLASQWMPSMMPSLMPALQTAGASSSMTDNSTSVAVSFTGPIYANTDQDRQKFSAQVARAVRDQLERR